MIRCLREKRRLLMLLGTLSMLLCVASAALWVRSYYASDEISWTGGRRDGNKYVEWQWAFSVSGPRATVSRRVLSFEFDGEETASEYETSWENERLARGGSRHLVKLVRFSLPPDNSPGPPTPALGFGDAREPWNEPRVSGFTSTLWVPFWFPNLAFGIMTCLFVARGLHGMRRRRLREGLCTRCGYDLCASPERCPECGTDVKPPR